MIDGLLPTRDVHPLRPIREDAAGKFGRSKSAAERPMEPSSDGPEDLGRVEVTREVHGEPSAIVMQAEEVLRVVAWATTMPPGALGSISRCLRGASCGPLAP